jgi:hypothetical protein
MAMAWMLAVFGCVPVGGPGAGVKYVGPSGGAAFDGAAAFVQLMTPGECERAHDATASACALSLSAAEQRDNAAANQAAEQRTERENADIRETGKKLEKERAAAHAREPDKCLTTRATPTDDTPGVADHLDRATISEALANVKTQVMACRDQFPVKGQVMVAVKVAGEGCVTAVIVESTPDSALGGCVASAVEQATFARTRSGGSFRYPFLF